VEMMTKRNRAKCRICLDVIESVNRHDFVRCKCGEIFIDGGNGEQSGGFTRAGAKDYNNFLIVLDNDEEVPYRSIVRIPDPIPSLPIVNEEYHPVMVRIPKKLHQLMKLKAIQNNLTIQKYLEALLRRELNV